MECKCHKCEKTYYCEDHEQQGLCDFCKTEEAINLSPGETIVDVKGVTWVRMEDSISHNLEGYLFRADNGTYKHASRVVYEMRW